MAKLLETIDGNLKEAYQQIVPGTMLHSYEIMNERRNNPELRESSFYTADGMIYFLDGSKGYTPQLAITKQPHNLVLQNLEEAFDQLTQNDNYYPDTMRASEAIKAQETQVFDLTKLKLKNCNSELSYVVISTFNGLGNEELRMAQCAYGHGADFLQNMKMLKDAGIDETKIYFLNPDYVRKYAAKGQIARASWLYGFVYNSQFSASVRDINNHGRVRGVRRGASVSEQEAPVGATHKNETSKEQFLLLPTKEQILPVLKPYIADPLWEKATIIVPEKAPVLGDIVQRLTDERLLAIHSREPCINALQEMFPEYNKK